mgnify:CR=1 FL=1
MKKVVFTLLFILPFGLMGHAQDFRLGITGGYNLNSPSAYESQSGFHGGIKGELGLPQVSKGLYLDFGVLLSSHGWKSPGYYVNGGYVNQNKPGISYEHKSNPYFLNIPIHIGYKFPVSRNMNMFVHAGPYFNIGLFGKLQEVQTVNKEKQSVVTTANNVFSSDILQRFDWGLGFRAGVEIVRHIQLAVGYDWGMKNINKNGVDCKNRTFVASCTYMF